MYCKKIFYFGLALASFSLDQFSKIMILRTLRWGEVVEIFPFFSLTYVGNTGVSFSLFNQSNPWVLIVVSLVLVVVFFVAFCVTHEANHMLAYTLVLSGATGNLVDRIYYGYVIDFLMFYIQDYHWPVFNLADTYITIAAIIIIYDGLRKTKNSRKTSSRG